MFEANENKSVGKRPLVAYSDSDEGASDDSGSTVEFVMDPRHLDIIRRRKALLENSAEKDAEYSSNEVEAIASTSRSFFANNSAQCASPNAAGSRGHSDMSGKDIVKGMLIFRIEMHVFFV